MSQPEKVKFLTINSERYIDMDELIEPDEGFIQALKDEVCLIIDEELASLFFDSQNGVDLAIAFLSTAYQKGKIWKES